jgi:hypothetical protein
MKYSLEIRVFLVKTFYSLQHISLVQKAFRTRFKSSDAPSVQTIKNLISNFEKTGSVSHVAPKTKNPSQKREMAKNQLKTMVSDFKSFSISKAASSIGVSKTLVYHILHDDLHLKPFKFQQWHKLEDHDYEKRLLFASWFLKQPAKNLPFYFFTDEAYFSLTLPLNHQNNRVWSDSQPCVGKETPLHDKKILVWCAISAKRVFGPYYFEESVNQHNYLEMLKNFFWPKVLRTADYKKYHFQQDGATPHTATEVQRWLGERFGKKFIDKNSWPPRSPDLNPCDFYLWGHLKQVAYNPLPKTLDDLKANLEREINKITTDILKDTFLNFQKRCELVISAGGGHIEI